MRIAFRGCPQREAVPGAGDANDHLSIKYQRCHVSGKTCPADDFPCFQGIGLRQKIQRLPRAGVGIRYRHIPQHGPGVHVESDQAGVDGNHVNLTVTHRHTTISRPTTQCLCRELVLVTPFHLSGHGVQGMVAVGAYTSSFVTVKLGWPFPAALLAAGLMAGLVGLLLGVPCLRLAGPYLAVATLAFGWVVPEILLKWSS